MKILLTPIVALFLFLGYKATPTREISGTVTSSSDGLGIPGVFVKSFPSKTTAKTNADGKYNIKAPITDTYLQISSLGFQTKKVTIRKSNVINISLAEDIKALNEVAVIAYGTQKRETKSMAMMSPPVTNAIYGATAGIRIEDRSMRMQLQNTENYAHITENAFKKAIDAPLSTFSIDVDAASYSNMRRFVNGGNLPNYLYWLAPYVSLLITYVTKIKLPL